MHAYADKMRQNAVATALIARIIRHKLNLAWFALDERLGAPSATKTFYPQEHQAVQFLAGG